jgi:hypothetical protein
MYMPLLSLRMAGNEDADPATKTNSEKVVEKYGLEAGLFSAFKNKDKSGMHPRAIAIRGGRDRSTNLEPLQAWKTE